MTHARRALHGTLGSALLLAVQMLPAAAYAQDRAELDRTRITGNRELPKVLYIVPWKKPQPGELSGRAPVSVLDEALAPLDRDVVRREQRYDALTHGQGAAATTTANSTGARPPP